MILNKYQKTFVLGLISLIFSIINFNKITPMNPDIECCDHLFYRAQSVAWFNLNDKQYLNVPSGNRLEEVYEYFFYKKENALTNQPPYVYRVTIPIFAGLLGKIININDSYRIINAILISFLIFGSSLLVLRITNSLLYSSISLLFFVLQKDFLQFYFYDFMLVDIASIFIFTYFIYFIILKKYNIAIFLGSVLGSLTKETLIFLGLTLSLILYKNLKKTYLLAIAFFPIFIQIILRNYFYIPSPPKLSEIYIFETALKPIIDIISAFGIISFFILGLLLSRQLILIGLPTFILIFIINSSEVADGKRIWYTIIPLIFIGYASIVEKLKFYSGRFKV